MRGNRAEDFADAFAQAVLFPEECAQIAHAGLLRLRSKGGRIDTIRGLARRFGVSPVTINAALIAYAREILRELC